MLLPPLKTEPHSHANVTDLAIPVTSFCGEDFETEERIEKSDIRNKIPADAQATTVLVGAHNGLSCTVSAFVRLAFGCELGNFAEVNIPVRFVIVLLGPDDDNVDYHEVGRSISTLMSDKIFLESAYRAKVRGVKKSFFNGMCVVRVRCAPFPLPCTPNSPPFSPGTQNCAKGYVHTITESFSAGMKTILDIGLLFTHTNQRRIQGRSPAPAPPPSPLHPF